ncbi:MAG: DUF4013 domain-containing protein [Bacteroidia bacterium]|nr:DUF4013 domain-containing protein [Bacteroidia bacterium]
MDSGKIIEDSFEYVKEGLVRKWDVWILLVFCLIVFPLYLGYIIRIFRGANPSPQLDTWGSMFIDGIRLLIVGGTYTIPVLILCFVFFGSADMIRSSVSPSTTGGLLIAVLMGAIILIIVAIITWLLVLIAVVRFAHTDSIGEAFNFGAIFNHIGKIGWMNYIIALLMLLIALVNITIICLLINMVISYTGIFLFLILLPFLCLFSPRYITLLYESTGTA